jgi:hypothetical protein
MGAPVSRRWSSISVSNHAWTLPSRTTTAMRTCLCPTLSGELFGRRAHVHPPTYSLGTNDRPVGLGSYEHCQQGVPRAPPSWGFPRYFRRTRATGSAATMAAAVSERMGSLSAPASPAPCRLSVRRGWGGDSEPGCGGNRHSLAPGHEIGPWWTIHPRTTRAWPSGR